MSEVHEGAVFVGRYGIALGATRCEYPHVTASFANGVPVARLVFTLFSKSRMLSQRATGVPHTNIGPRFSRLGSTHGL
jgi:hypothetical protein